MRSWIVPTRETFKLFFLGIGTTAAIGLSVSSVLSTAWAQQSVQSQIQGQPTVGKTESLKSPLASQERKPHRLIRKPSLPKSGMSAMAQGVTVPPATTTAPAEDNALKAQPLTVKSPAPAPATTLQSSVGVIQAASSRLMSSVSSAGATATAKPSSQNAGLTAAASGGTPSSSSTVPRQLGRLMSEMPGMTQMIVPVSPSTPPPTPTNPAIGLSPASMFFTAQQGGGNPATQTLSISNTGGGTLTWTAGDNAPWLALSPGSGTGNGTIPATVTTGALTVGTYSATVTISAVGAATVSVPVTFTVTATPVLPAIGMSPTSLSFAAQQGGGNPAAQTFTISNAGGGTLNWSVSPNTTWLAVSPASGTGNGAVTVSVTTGILPAGSYTGNITLSATGASSTTVPVTFTVAAVPTISLSPTSLTFTAMQGGANPANQTVALTNAGGAVNWTVSDNALWLGVSPASGSSSSTLTAAVNTTGLATGTYNGAITVSAVGSSSKTVAVTLTVSAPTTSSATLTWNPVSDADLVGYKVYRSTTSGVYGAPIATIPAAPGVVTSYVSTGLQVGTTYFWVITAYDSTGKESPFSNEVSKSIF